MMAGPRLDPAVTTTLDIRRPSPELLARAARFPSATLHEAAGKIGALPMAIKPVAPSFTLCGPAVTVQAPGADNLWLHRAIYAAQPGDVLVVHVADRPEHGYWGEIMSTAAKVRRLGGLVIDGGVRDRVLLEEIGFPVFARGLSIRGTDKDLGARGWINAPILVGDVALRPGDLVVGDADGVVALPQADLATILDAAAERDAKEATILKRLEAGETTLAIYGWE
jgi:4-hydroxy-4-methyl-2-oxoglutarate aldolase